ncbi:MAG TPA: CRISPR-associated protein Cas2 [Chthoniobacterales bacterium]|nr:CRISPR-associated protein Cas2 [Chthoniobacterales bacterium]
MANNLHISYDLHKPEKNYEAVIAKIKTLGNWAKVHYSYWYVNSGYTARQACDAVWSVMDADDSLYVVDATNNAAWWQNLNATASNYIIDQWPK